MQVRFKEAGRGGRCFRKGRAFSTTVAAAGGAHRLPKGRLTSGAVFGAQRPGFPDIDRAKGEARLGKGVSTVTINGPGAVAEAVPRALAARLPQVRSGSTRVTRSVTRPLIGGSKSLARLASATVPPGGGSAGRIFIGSNEAGLALVLIEAAADRGEAAGLTERHGGAVAITLVTPRAARPVATNGAGIQAGAPSRVAPTGNGGRTCRTTATSAVWARARPAPGGAGERAGSGALAPSRATTGRGPFSTTRFRPSRSLLTRSVIAASDLGAVARAAERRAPARVAARRAMKKNASSTRIYRSYCRRFASSC